MCALASTVSASEFNLDQPYLGLNQIEDHLHCAYTSADGQKTAYSFAMMYEYTEDDVKTFSDFLKSNGDGVTALYMNKLDANGDGNLSLCDFVSIYKDVYVKPEGFTYAEDGQWYPWQLVKPYLLKQEDRERVCNILARIDKSYTGVTVSNYDYNLNGEIDICDLVAINRYRAQNPCRFMKDNYGWEINPQDMASLLDAAESFGLENFLITCPTECTIPYSIVLIDDGFYSSRNMQANKSPFHAMQVLPREDTVLANNGFDFTFNWGTGTTFWRFRYPDDTKFSGDVLWIARTHSSDTQASSPFVLIPLDENGRRLGTLYPNAKEAPLAPQGVTFENEEFGQEIS
jgi:hypothetical protein